MRTIEFKLDLNRCQQTKVNDWLNIQRWVWNCGLHLLEEFDSFTAWDKVGKTWVPCSPIQWKCYKDDNDNLVPFTRLAQTKPYRMSCPVHAGVTQASLPDELAKRSWYRQPELNSPTHFGLLYYFAQKNHEDKPWFCEVPCKIVAGTLKALADGWSAYKAGKRKHPRYKRYQDKITTLINNNAKSIRVSGKQIILPKLGKVTIKTLDKRWDALVPIATMKIIKEPSGYYLQLTGELPRKRFKPSSKAVGLTLGRGGTVLFTTDGDKVVESPLGYERLEKRLCKLQRKLSRQQNLCQITTYNPDQGEHFLSCPITPQKGANKAKTQQKISQLHEKIRRTRRAFNHKISTKLVQEYSGIATAKSDLQRITRKPKPIVNKEGTGYDPNGASTKTQFNKSVLAKGLGQLTSLIKQKAAVHGREFIEIAPKSIPDEQRQRAEHHSKRLQLPRALYLSSFFGRYQSWDWELTPGESLVTLNQEAMQMAPLCDAETASKSSSENTDPIGLVDVPQAISTLNTLNCQRNDSSALTGDELTITVSQLLPETEAELTASYNSEVEQQKKARRHRLASPVYENKSEKRKRRPAVGDDPG